MKVRIPDHVDMAKINDLTKGKIYHSIDGETIADDVGFMLDIITTDHHSGPCYHLAKQAAWEVIE